jgi:hypothetical protein
MAAVWSASLKRRTFTDRCRQSLHVSSTVRCPSAIGTGSIRGEGNVPSSAAKPQCGSPRRDTPIRNGSRGTRTRSIRCACQPPWGVGMSRASAVGVPGRRCAQAAHRTVISERSVCCVMARHRILRPQLQRNGLRPSRPGGRSARCPAGGRRGVLSLPWLLELVGNGWAGVIVVVVVGVVSLIGRGLILGTGVLLALLRPDDEISVTWRGVHIAPHPARTSAKSERFGR